MTAPVRHLEVLAALSLTMDLASGAPVEKGLRTTAVAAALATRMDLDAHTRRAVVHAALLRAVGCTAHAPENAELFEDDIAFQRALKELDPGDPGVFAEQLARFGAWAGAQRQPVLVRRFGDIAATEGPVAASNGCEVSRALGPRLGLSPDAVRALDDVWERWDGLGLPFGRKGDELALVTRIAHVAEMAVLGYLEGGAAGAVREVARRSGGHLDPDVAARLLAEPDAVLAPLDQPDVLAAVLESEPEPVAMTAFGDVLPVCEALATVVDLKGRWLLGHSTHVAELAAGAARLCGFTDEAVTGVHAAGLVHDLGRVTVSSAIWDKPGPLSDAERERVRLHAYWTERVLHRIPALAPLAHVASAHHERADGSGYHRGTRDHQRAEQLVAAADVLAALTEDRPHRPAYGRDDAARLLCEQPLDADAVAAVLEAVGHDRPRASRPAGLTEREAEVVRLAARGLSNNQIGAELHISARTVGHHLAHVYDKTGRRTRAGIAVFAIEHGLVRAGGGPVIGEHMRGR